MRNHLTREKKFIRNLSMLVIALYPAVVWSQQFEAILGWSQKADLGTVVSGVIETVYVDVGDKVKKGDRLVELDDSVFKAHVAEFKAKLQSVEEELKEAKRERDRALELYERTVLSQHDLQLAKNSFLKAKAKYENINAIFTAKKFELKYSTVRAPFDAIVLNRNAEPGQVIATEFKQEPLVTVAASNKMIASLLVAEEKLSAITKGQAAKVVVGSVTFTGKVQSIEMELSSDKSGTTGYPVHVEFTVKDVMLRSGQTATVNIE